MEQPERRPSPPAWAIRRAGLLDVPAVARLLAAPGGVPGSALGAAPNAVRPHPLVGSSEEAVTSATRLVLTHVGLDVGEFWVAVDGADHVLAAVVLLPSGDDGQERVQLALRLELGLLLKQTLEESLGGVVPQAHWLLLPAVPPGYEELLPHLLAAAMPTVDASGLPVLSLQHGPPAEALTSAGFELLEGTLVVAPSSASLRVEPDRSGLGI